MRSKLNSNEKDKEENTITNFDAGNEHQVNQHDQILQFKDASVSLSTKLAVHT